MTIENRIEKNSRRCVTVAVATIIFTAGLLLAVARPGPAQAQQVQPHYECEFSAAGPLSPPMALIAGSGNYAFDSDPDGTIECMYTDGIGSILVSGRILLDGTYMNMICLTGRFEGQASVALGGASGFGMQYTIDFVAGHGTMSISWSDGSQQGTGNGVVSIFPTGGDCLSGIAALTMDGSFALDRRAVEAQGVRGG